MGTRPVKGYMSELALTVNGRGYHLSPVAGETLAGLLRHRLRLTGTKIACQESECGSCTVLVDGEPILSCMYPAERAEGKSVLTIEGLAAITPDLAFAALDVLRDLP